MWKFIQFGTNGSVWATSSNLTTKYVASLCSSTRLSSTVELVVCMNLASLIKFLLYYLHLIITQHKFSISSKAIINISLSTINNFTLTRNRRYFIIIFIRHIRHVLLYWSEHWHVVLVLLWCDALCTIFHKVGAGGSANFYCTNFVTSVNHFYLRALIFIPSIFVDHSVTRHWHVMMDTWCHTSKLILIVHIESNSSNITFRNC